MQPVQDNNTRWILELERQELIRATAAFDEHFGSFSHIFLAGIEAFALLAYLLITCLLLYNKKCRTKTNALVVFWSFLNFLVLLEKLTSTFCDEHQFIKEVHEIGQILAGLARNYGTMLSVVWVFTKYFQRPKPKYDWLMYFLMSGPALVCFAILVHYFGVNRFVFEAYTPLSDVGNLTVYFGIALVAIFCRIFDAESRNISQYPFLVSLVNLVTNVPICLMTIFLRFVLDEGWVYRFHIYFIDFLVNVISCSNAFIVLLIIILYNEEVRKAVTVTKQGYTPEKVPFRDDV